VLLTRFDFAGLIALGEDEVPSAPEAACRSMKPSTFILALLALVAACASSSALFPSLQQAKLQAKTAQGDARLLGLDRG
jgi:hypothetical protein